MCKVISSESVIGNFMIESVKREGFEIDVEQLITFDKALSAGLKAHNYYTGFDFKKITDFQNSYPFFASIDDDSSKLTVCQTMDVESLKTKLVRYFRIGMPKLVVEEMKSASKTVLGV